MKYKYLKLIFYHNCSWQQKVWNYGPAYKTIFFMGIASTMDLMSIHYLLAFFFPSIPQIHFYQLLLAFIILVCVFYFLLEYKYDYKRMVTLSKIIVGNKGKWFWIFFLYVLTILMPLIVCGLWWAKNNGYI